MCRSIVNCDEMEEKEIDDCQYQGRIGLLSSPADLVRVESNE